MKKLVFGILLLSSLSTFSQSDARTKDDAVVFNKPVYALIVA
jgi:hypothetical protein